MERYNYYQRERENPHSSNPSFSSTLLDAIYRSIDSGEEELDLYKETMRKKQSNNNNKNTDIESFQRACMIEKWIGEKSVVRRKSAEDFVRKSRNTNSNSSSCSSECSSGGVFSSSETESSVFGVSSVSSCYGFNKPKPIRTTINPSSHTTQKFNNTHVQDYKNYTDFAQKAKNEGGFLKTKSKALKIYGDLKKVKQPISPGGRLASFLNSIFTSGNHKKAKVSSNSGNVSTSACSTASSFSRSCLSKNTPKSINGAKRSVRFLETPRGHNNLHHHHEEQSIRNSINEELKFHAMEKNRRVEEAAKELLRNYQKNFEFKKMEIFDDDEDDDVASCASSDLFELDNLSAIGIDNIRYREELPVYETTHLGTNRAIANGLIL